MLSWWRTSCRKRTPLQTLLQTDRLCPPPGTQVLLVIRRQNWLARAVSSAELQMDKGETTRVLGSEARHQAMRQFFARASYDETAAGWAERLDRQSGAIIDQGKQTRSIPPLGGAHKAASGSRDADLALWRVLQAKWPGVSWGTAW